MTSAAHVLDEPGRYEFLAGADWFEHGLSQDRGGSADRPGALVSSRYSSFAGGLADPGDKDRQDATVPQIQLSGCRS